MLWQHQFSQPVLRTNQGSRIKIIDVDSVADLNNDAVPDIIVIMSDSVTRFFTGLSGRNGVLLWQIPLNLSCIPIDRPVSVDYVISSSCFKELPGNPIDDLFQTRYRLTSVLSTVYFNDLYYLTFRTCRNE